MRCEHCGGDLIEVDNPMRPEFRHRRGVACPPRPAAEGAVEPPASPDGDTGRGTGDSGPHGAAQADDAWFSDVAESVRPVHYRDAAASLDEIADRLESTDPTNPGLGGIRLSAMHLRRTARNLTKGDTDE